MGKAEVKHKRLRRELKNSGYTEEIVDKIIDLYSK